MKKAFSICLIFILLFALSTASYAQEKVLLSLGDSISTGYGLENYEDGFVSIIGKEYTKVINKAVN